MPHISPVGAEAQDAVFRGSSIRERQPSVLSRSSIASRPSYLRRCSSFGESAGAAFCVHDLAKQDDLDEFISLQPRSSVADVEEASSAEEKPKLVRIPSFSIEDRREREIVSRAPWVGLVRSDLFIGLIFTVTYLIPHFASASIGSDLAWIGVFIFWHLCVTMAKSIPDNTSSAEELNMRTNASTFVAMVLYQALGVWSCERFNRVENIFPTYLQHDGDFQWGTVFPVFMWGMSALVLVRESHSAVVVDNSIVVTNKGSASLGLFRRHPTPLEKLTSVAGSFATSSLWQILPAHERRGELCHILALADSA